VVQGRTVEMTARVRGAKVDLPDRPSRDLQTLDDHPDIVVVTRAAPGVSSGQPIVFVVHVKLETDMWLVREDMRLAFLGDANVRYPWGGALRLGGTIELTRGEAEAYGRRFRIDGGVVNFDPAAELDPVVDVRGHWDSPEATVHLRVAGRLSRPRITFASDPAHSQDEIVNLLVLGRLEGPDGGQSSVNDTAARQTGALLAGIGAALAQESVREALPDVVPIIAIEPGDEVTATRYRAGSQVADRLYVEGSVGGAGSTRSGQNTQEVRMEYRLSPRWSVEGHGGDENSGADLLWSYSY
jgi:translocation and assembly module TamB